MNAWKQASQQCGPLRDPHCVLSDLVPPVVFNDTHVTYNASCDTTCSTASGATACCTYACSGGSSLKTLSLYRSADQQTTAHRTPLRRSRGFVVPPHWRHRYNTTCDERSNFQEFNDYFLPSS